MKANRPLSKRLRKVLELLTQGYTRKAISVFLKVERNTVDKAIERLTNYFEDDPRISNGLLSIDAALSQVGLEYLNSEGYTENKEKDTVEELLLLSLIQSYNQSLRDMRHRRRRGEAVQIIEGRWKESIEGPIIKTDLSSLNESIKEKIKAFPNIEHKKALLLFRADVLLELQWCYKDMLIPTKHKNTEQRNNELIDNISEIIKEIKSIAEVCQSDELYCRALMTEGELQFILEDFAEAIRLITQSKDKTQDKQRKMALLYGLVRIHSFLYNINWDRYGEIEHQFDEDSWAKRRKYANEARKHKEYAKTLQSEIEDVRLAQEMEYQTECAVPNDNHIATRELEDNPSDEIDYLEIVEGRRRTILKVQSGRVL